MLPTAQSSRRATGAPCIQSYSLYAGSDVGSPEGRGMPTLPESFWRGVRRVLQSHGDGAVVPATRTELVPPTRPGKTWRKPRAPFPPHAANNGLWTVCSVRLQGRLFFGRSPVCIIAPDPPPLAGIAGTGPTGTRSPLTVPSAPPPGKPPPLEPHRRIHRLATATLR